MMNKLEKSFYENGKKNGKWTVHYDDKKTKIKEINCWKNGKLEGPAKYFYESGNLEKKGSFEEGKAVEKWTVYYDNENKNIKEFNNWENGELEGKTKSFYESGNLEKEGSFKEGKADKKWTVYYDNENKNIKEFNNWKDDKLEGKTKSFYESGNLEKEGSFKEGKAVEKWTVYYDNENKNIKEFNDWKDGKLNGETKSFYENGNLKKEGKFVKGKKEGEWKYYDSENNLRTKGSWKKGKRYEEWIEYDEKRKLEERRYYCEDGNLYNKEASEEKFQQILTSHSTESEEFFLTNREFNFKIDNKFLKECLKEDEINRSLDFTNSIFKEKVDFSGKTFKKKIVFTNAKFEKEINFKDAKFCEEAIFINISCKDDLDFTGVKFEKLVTFRKARFYKKAIFSKIKCEDLLNNPTKKKLENLSQAKDEKTLDEFKESYHINEKTLEDNINNVFFKKGEIDQNLATNCDIHLRTVIIDKYIAVVFRAKAEISFEKVIFEDKVRFNEADFKKANFYQTKFKGVASFSDAKFNDETHFSLAEFENIVHFDKVSLFEDTDFTNTIFQNKITFEGTKFRNKINFYKTKFNDVVSFEKSTFQIEDENSPFFQYTEFTKIIGFKNVKIISEKNNSLEFDSVVFSNNYPSSFHQIKKTTNEPPLLKFKNIFFPSQFIFSDCNLSKTEFDECFIEKAKFLNCEFKKEHWQPFHRDTFYFGKTKKKEDVQENKLKSDLILFYKEPCQLAENKGIKNKHFLFLPLFDLIILSSLGFYFCFDFSGKIIFPIVGIIYTIRLIPIFHCLSVKNKIKPLSIICCLFLPLTFSVTKLSIIKANKDNQEKEHKQANKDNQEKEHKRADKEQLYRQMKSSFEASKNWKQAGDCFIGELEAKREKNLWNWIGLTIYKYFLGYAERFTVLILWMVFLGIIVTDYYYNNCAVMSQTCYNWTESFLKASNIIILPLALRGEIDFENLSEIIFVVFTFPFWFALFIAIKRRFRF